MSFESEMRISPLMLAVWPNHAPRLTLFKFSNVTFSLQVPVTRIVEPTPALGNAALMLRNALGFAPEQSTRICPDAARGNNTVTEIKSFCQSFMGSSLFRKSTLPCAHDSCECSGEGLSAN